MTPPNQLLAAGTISDRPFPNKAKLASRGGRPTGKMQLSRLWAFAGILMPGTECPQNFSPHDDQGTEK